MAASGHSDELVLKGGVLLAAFDVRRPTRDVDLQAQVPRPLLAKYRGFLENGQRCRLTASHRPANRPARISVAIYR